MLAEILTAAQVTALPVARAENVTADTRARLGELLGYEFGEEIPTYQPGDAINGALFGVFYGGQVASERCEAARQALAENGYVAPTSVGPRDVLEQMQRIWAALPWGSDEYEKAVSYGVAVALAAGEGHAALCMLDGPEGAGYAWQLTLEELQRKIEESTPADPGIPDVSAELRRLPVHLLRLAFEAGMRTGEAQVAGCTPELSRLPDPELKAVMDAIALLSLHSGTRAEAIIAKCELNLLQSSR